MEPPKPLRIGIIISVQENKPCVWLRAQYTEPQLIKDLILASIHNLPIVVMPSYNNPLKFINSLKEKGLMYEEGGELKFLY